MSTANTRSSPLFQNFQSESQNSEEKDFPSHDDFVDLLHGSSSLSNGNSPDFSMLVAPKYNDLSSLNTTNPAIFLDFQTESQHNIAVSTPNPRSSPLFQNFQADSQTSVSPIGSPYSPERTSYRPVTKNRVLGFSEGEDIQSNGFELFGYGTQGHIGSERTLSSSSNTSLLSEASFSHILRSIHDQGETGTTTPLPATQGGVANNGPLNHFFQSRISEDVSPYNVARNKNGFNLPTANVTPTLINSRFSDSDENFRANSSDLNSPMVGETSPSSSQTDFTGLLESLNLNGDGSGYSTKSQSPKEDMWIPQNMENPVIQSYIRAYQSLPSALPTNQKQLLQLLRELTDLQEGIHIIFDPYVKERISHAFSDVIQKVLQQMSNNANYSPPSVIKDSPTSCGYGDISFERSPRYQIENTGSFDSSQRLAAWNGTLPRRNHRNATYSCKVFLGGLPWDVTESNLFHAFKLFNPVKVEWPIKDGHLSQSKGYAYMVFESEKQLRLLLQHCSFSVMDGGCWYHKVSSKKMKSKDAQIIPWSQWDNNFYMSATPKLDSQKTVFVGALHGMINAHGLAIIMEELFGGVIYAGIDTDRHRYPIGSGRVAFNNSESYVKAITARFVDVKVTQKFTKTIQVDPYLEDATCSVCNLQQGPYFCRDFSCFRYFCKTCFHFHHSLENLRSHQYIMRNSAKPQSTPGSFLPASLSYRSTGNGHSVRNVQQQVHWQAPYYNGLGNNGRGNQYQSNIFHNNSYQNQMHNPAGLWNNSSSPYLR